MPTVKPDLTALYRDANYQALITECSSRSDLDTQETRLLGIALLRNGDAIAAEPLLELAAYLGDQEARVEYGNCMRVAGRYDDAVEYLTQLLPSLDGELKHRATRWLGVTSAQTGKMNRALELLENARRGYKQLKDPMGEAKTTQNLALVLADMGDRKRGAMLLEQAVRAFKAAGAVNLTAQGLSNLLCIHSSIHTTPMNTDFAELIAEVSSIVPNEQSYANLHLWRAQIILHDTQPMGQEEYVQLLDKFTRHAEQLGDSENQVIGLTRKIEYHLARHDTSEAMRLVYRAPQDRHGQFPSGIRILRAMINRRLNNYREAIEELQAVMTDLSTEGHIAEVPRAQLQLAYAFYLNEQLDCSADTLRAALQGMLRIDMSPSMRPEIEELSELLHFAALEPSIAPYLEPVMDSLAGVLGQEHRSESRSPHRVRLQLKTLGRPSVLRDGHPVTFQLKGTVPLLVYLTLTPNRSMHEILFDLYPEKEPSAGSAYVRKSIQELRDLLGPSAVLTEGTRNFSRYRLGRDVQTDLDLNRFFEAISQKKTARALALYRGDFLPGWDESDWVNVKRTSARLALTFELRHQMGRHQQSKEWRRVILVANQVLNIDPYDSDVHDQRIEAAKRVGTTMELGNFIAARQALLN